MVHDILTHDSEKDTLYKEAEKIGDDLRGPIETYLKNNNILGGHDPDEERATHHIVNCLLNECVKEDPSLHPEISTVWDNYAGEFRRIRDEEVGDEYEEFCEQVESYFDDTKELRRKLIDLRDELRKEYPIE